MKDLSGSTLEAFDAYCPSKPTFNFKNGLLPTFVSEKSILD